MPLARTAVKAQLEPQLRLYRRLWLSRIDLHEAKANIVEIRAFLVGRNPARFLSRSQQRW